MVMTAEGEACPDAERPGLAAHRVKIREVRPGLSLHADDAVDEFDAVVTGLCTPGLHVVLLLEGALDLWYGERPVALRTAARRAAPALVRAPLAQARLRPQSRPQSLLFNAVEPDTFRRRFSKGRYARRLSLGVSGDWLAQLEAASGAAMPAHLDSLLSTHLSMRVGQPTPRAAALAEQIVRPPAYQSILQAIYLESRVLDLLGEVFEPLQSVTPAGVPDSAVLGPRDYRRMADLRAFLGSEAAQRLSLDAIARHAGMNANAMQRQFRAVFGTTIFDFLRENNLQRARLALERDAISVKQAAVLAGYAGAENFATAYKRRFGVTPKQARRGGQP